MRRGGGVAGRRESSQRGRPTTPVKVITNYYHVIITLNDSRNFARHLCEHQTRVMIGTAI